MKRIIKLSIIILGLLLSYISKTEAQEKKQSQTAIVVINADIDCAKCKKRIENNITFEKGVKELEVNVDKKTVKIKYRKDKTNSEKLLTAIQKLGYTSFIKEEKDAE